MSALSADRDSKRSEGAIKSYAVDASTTIYKGSLVSLVAGYLQPAADTSGDLFCGVAVEQVDNSAGSAGALSCRVHKEGEFEFAFSGTAAQADVGKAVYAVDDQTVALAATTTNDVLVGYIAEYVSASKVRVRINRAVQ